MFLRKLSRLAAWVVFDRFGEIKSSFVLVGMLLILLAAGALTPLVTRARPAVSAVQEQLLKKTPRYHLYINMSKHAVILEDEGYLVSGPVCTGDGAPTNPQPGINCGVIASPNTVSLTVNLFNALPDERYQFQSDLFQRCTSVEITPPVPVGTDGVLHQTDILTNFHGNATIPVNAQNCVPMNTGVNAGSSDSKYYVNMVDEGTNTHLPGGMSYNVRFTIVE